VYEHLFDYAETLDGEWLFPNSRGNPWDKAGFRRNLFVPWKQAAGVEHVQWRHLRHYYASSISAVGASILQCSRWMGHASIVTTMDRYGFLFDSDEARIMDALAAR
jgi:site-specific recombinase XerD